MVNPDIDKAVSILKAGGVIIFPTDTVWGIGASLERLEAIRRLYQIKKREKNKPTAVLVADIIVTNRLGVITPEAKTLVDKYWPGGLTLVVKARTSVPGEILGPAGTVGLRQPDHKLVLGLLGKLGTGLVTASANFTGEAAPLSKELIDQTLMKQAKMVLEGKAGGKRPSTVVDITQKPFKIIREGEVKLEIESNL